MNVTKSTSDQEERQRSAYDVFLAADQAVAESLCQRLRGFYVFEEVHGHLQGRPLRVYWNTETGGEGERGKGFQHALCNSSVVVLILSRHTFENTARREDGQLSNDVLLQHDVALELWDMGYVNHIIPLYVGDTIIEGGDLPDAVVELIRRGAIARLREAGLHNLPTDSSRRLSNVPSLLEGRTAMQTLSVIPSTFRPLKLEEHENSPDHCAKTIYDAVHALGHFLTGDEVYRHWKHMICESLLSHDLFSVQGMDSLVAKLSMTGAAYRLDSPPQVDSTSAGHEIWASRSMRDADAFREDVHALLKGFIDGPVTSTWRLCNLVLWGFLVDPETVIEKEGNDENIGSLSWWRALCQTDEGCEEMIAQVDRFVEQGWIRSKKLQQWGYDVARVGHERKPRASCVVIAGTVKERLRDTVTREMWQKVVEGWRDRLVQDCVRDAGTFLEKFVVEQILGMHVMGRLVKTKGYIVFLRVPELLGYMFWQWLGCEQIIPEHKPESIEDPPQQHGICLLVSNRGRVLPESKHLNSHIVAAIAATLNRIAALPQSLLDADSWPLSTLDDMDFSTWPCEPFPRLPKNAEVPPSGGATSPTIGPGERQAPGATDPVDQERESANESRAPSPPHDFGSESPLYELVHLPQQPANETRQMTAEAPTGVLEPTASRPTDHGARDPAWLEVQELVGDLVAQLQYEKLAHLEVRQVLATLEAQDPAPPQEQVATMQEALFMEQQEHLAWEAEAMRCRAQNLELQHRLGLMQTRMAQLETDMDAKHNEVKRLMTRCDQLESLKLAQDLELSYAQQALKQQQHHQRQQQHQQGPQVKTTNASQPDLAELPDSRRDGCWDGVKNKLSSLDEALASLESGLHSPGQATVVNAELVVPHPAEAQQAAQRSQDQIDMLFAAEQERANRLSREVYHLECQLWDAQKEAELAQSWKHRMQQGALKAYIELVHVGLAAPPKGAEGLDIIAMFEGLVPQLPERIAALTVHAGGGPLGKAPPEQQQQDTPRTRQSKWQRQLQERQRQLEEVLAADRPLSPGATPTRRAHLVAGTPVPDTPSPAHHRQSPSVPLPQPSTPGSPARPSEPSPPHSPPPLPLPSPRSLLNKVSDLQTRLAGVEQELAEHKTGAAQGYATARDILHMLDREANLGVPLDVLERPESPGPEVTPSQLQGLLQLVHRASMSVVDQWKQRVDALTADLNLLHTKSDDCNQEMHVCQQRLKELVLLIHSSALAPPLNHTSMSVSYSQASLSLSCDSIPSLPSLPDGPQSRVDSMSADALLEASASGSFGALVGAVCDAVPPLLTQWVDLLHLETLVHSFLDGLAALLDPLSLSAAADQTQEEPVLWAEAGGSALGKRMKQVHDSARHAVQMLHSTRTAEAGLQECCGALAHRLANSLPHGDLESFAKAMDQLEARLNALPKARPREDPASARHPGDSLPPVSPTMSPHHRSAPTPQVPGLQDTNLGYVVLLEEFDGRLSATTGALGRAKRCMAAGAALLRQYGEVLAAVSETAEGWDAEVTEDVRVRQMAEALARQNREVAKLRRAVDAQKRTQGRVQELMRLKLPALLHLLDGPAAPGTAPPSSASSASSASHASGARSRSVTPPPFEGSVHSASPSACSAELEDLWSDVEARAHHLRGALDAARRDAENERRRRRDLEDRCGALKKRQAQVGQDLAALHRFLTADPAEELDPLAFFAGGRARAGSPSPRGAGPGAPSVTTLDIQQAVVRHRDLLAEQHALCGHLRGDLQTCRAELRAQRDALAGAQRAHLRLTHMTLAMLRDVGVLPTAPGPAAPPRRRSRSPPPRDSPAPAAEPLRALSPPLPLLHIPPAHHLSPAFEPPPDPPSPDAYDPGPVTPEALERLLQRAVAEARRGHDAELKLQDYREGLLTIMAFLDCMVAWAGDGPAPRGGGVSPRPAAPEWGAPPEAARDGGLSGGEILEKIRDKLHVCQALLARLHRHETHVAHVMGLLELPGREALPGAAASPDLRLLPTPDLCQWLERIFEAVGALRLEVAAAEREAQAALEKVAALQQRHEAEVQQQQQQWQATQELEVSHYEHLMEHAKQQHALQLQQERELVARERKQIGSLQAACAALEEEGAKWKQECATARAAGAAHETRITEQAAELQGLRQSLAGLQQELANEKASARADLQRSRGTSDLTEAYEVSLLQIWEAVCAIGRLGDGSNPADAVAEWVAGLAAPLPDCVQHVPSNPSAETLDGLGKLFTVHRKIWSRLGSLKADVARAGQVCAASAKAAADAAAGHRGLQEQLRQVGQRVHGLRPHIAALTAGRDVELPLAGADEPPSPQYCEQLLARLHGALDSHEAELAALGAQLLDVQHRYHDAAPEGAPAAPRPGPALPRLRHAVAQLQGALKDHDRRQLSVLQAIYRALAGLCSDARAPEEGLPGDAGACAARIRGCLDRLQQSAQQRVGALSDLQSKGEVLQDALVVALTSVAATGHYDGAPPLPPGVAHALQLLQGRLLQQSDLVQRVQSEYTLQEATCLHVKQELVMILDRLELVPLLETSSNASDGRLTPYTTTDGSRTPHDGSRTPVDGTNSPPPPPPPPKLPFASPASTCTASSLSAYSLSDLAGDLRDLIAELRLRVEQQRTDLIGSTQTVRKLRKQVRHLDEQGKKELERVEAKLGQMVHRVKELQIEVQVVRTPPPPTHTSSTCITLVGSPAPCAHPEVLSGRLRQYT